MLLEHYHAACQREGGSKDKEVVRGAEVQQSRVWGRAWSLVPGGSGGVCLRCRRPEFHPWVTKTPWRRK